MDSRNSRENPNDAHIANVLSEDEARRIASNIAKLPTLLGKGDASIRRLLPATRAVFSAILLVSDALQPRSAVVGVRNPTLSVQCY